MTHPDERDRVIVGEATVVRHGDGLIALAVSDARAALGALVVARSRAMLHRQDVGQGGASDA